MTKPYRRQTWAAWPATLATAQQSRLPQLLFVAADDSPAEWRARAERLEEVDRSAALRCREIAQQLEDAGLSCLRELPP